MKLTKCLPLTVLLPVSAAPSGSSEPTYRMHASGVGCRCGVVAGRAFTSRTTLQRIEAGDPGVGIGIYAATLQAHGLLDGLADLADLRQRRPGSGRNRTSRTCSSKTKNEVRCLMWKFTLIQTAITRPIGLLRRHVTRRAETVTFEYEDIWLADNNNRPPHEPALTVTRGVFPTPRNQAILGSIGDSAPATWGRRLMQRSDRRKGKAPHRTLTEAVCSALPMNPPRRASIPLDRRSDIPGVSLPLLNGGGYGRSLSAFCATKRPMRISNSS